MPTDISSRTPEGLPGRCPLCGAAVAVTPCEPIGDAPCPACGCLLLGLPTAAGAFWFDATPLLAVDRAELQALLDRFSPPADADSPAGADSRAGADSPADADSLDVVEFIMELEELAYISVPDGLADELAARIGDFPAFVAWLRDFVARGQAG